MPLVSYLPADPAAAARVLLHVARHEAAHAVAGWLLGDPPLWLDLDPPAVQFRPLDADPENVVRRAGRSAIVYFAGMEATARAEGHHPGTDWRESFEDLRLVDRGVAYITTDRRQANRLRDALQRVARTVVLDAAAPIEVLAGAAIEALAAGGRVDGDAIAALLEREAREVRALYRLAPPWGSLLDGRR